MVFANIITLQIHSCKTLSGLNLGVWCTKTHAPWIQGAKTLLHADFAQPVSERFQWTSDGVKSSQYLQQNLVLLFH